MASKLVTVGAVAAGYVLGSRAGRERYEAIKKQAQRVWSNPKVRDAASSAQDVAAKVKDKATGDKGPTEPAVDPLVAPVGGVDTDGSHKG